MLPRPIGLPPSGLTAARQCAGSTVISRHVPREFREYGDTSYMDRGTHLHKAAEHALMGDYELMSQLEPHDQDKLMVYVNQCLIEWREFDNVVFWGQEVEINLGGVYGPFDPNQDGRKAYADFLVYGGAPVEMITVVDLKGGAGLLVEDDEPELLIHALGFAAERGLWPAAGKRTVPHIKTVIVQPWYWDKKEPAVRTKVWRYDEMVEVLAEVKGYFDLQQTYEGTPVERIPDHYFQPGLHCRNCAAACPYVDRKRHDVLGEMRYADPATLKGEFDYMAMDLETAQKIVLHRKAFETLIETAMGMVKAAEEAAPGSTVLQASKRRSGRAFAAPIQEIATNSGVPVEWFYGPPEPRTATAVINDLRAKGYDANADVVEKYTSQGEHVVLAPRKKALSAKALQSMVQLSQNANT